MLTGKTAPPDVDDDSKYFLMSKLKFRVTDSAYNALFLTSERYNVTQQEIVELAPFLFCWAAEASLHQRRERLRQYFSRSEEKFAAESESINGRDLFGLLLDGEADFGNGSLASEYTDNPFARFLRGLANDIGGHATLEAYGFRDFPDYRVCVEEATMLAGGDSSLAEEILHGHISLSDMPKEIDDIGMRQERVEWVRLKIEEFRDKMIRRFSERSKNV